MLFTFFFLKADVCRKDSSTADMRYLGKRIGYSIQDIHQKDNNGTIQSLYQARKGNKSSKKQQQEQQQHDHQNSNLNSSSGQSVKVNEAIRGKCDVLSGLHLHRCKKCKSVLMKPLLCGRCKNVCYCSTKCQASDWEDEHSSKCRILKPPN